MNSSFIDNQACTGGAISSYWATVIVAESVMRGNATVDVCTGVSAQGTPSGGAMNAIPSPVTPHGVRFEDNSLALSELQPVHENGGHYHWRILARNFNQAQMPVMNVAHGWYATNVSLASKPCAQLVDRSNYFHCQLTVAARRK